MPSYKMLNTPRISYCYIIWVWVIFMNCLSNVSITIFDMITYLVLFCGQCSQIRITYCSDKVHPFCNLLNFYYFHCMLAICTHIMLLISLLLICSFLLLLSLLITIRHLFEHHPPPPQFRLAHTHFLWHSSIFFYIQCLNLQGNLVMFA